MSGDLRKHLHAIIDARTARIDFLAVYPAKVVAQNADGTLELQPEDSRLAGFSKVPIRHGLPGCVVKVQAGATVVLGFENGDNCRPFASLWGPSALVELVLNGGVKHIALGEDVKAALDGLVAAFNGHTHGVTGAVTKTPDMPIAGLNTNVSSATVKST
jgi:hypothetical protein